MDISVIVPIYGVENYIESALHSLFTQTKTDGVEFILVDDCTKDSSMDIAQAVIAQHSNLDVRIINKPINGGLAAARQTGLEAAQGEYIVHVDSDDWCDATMLEDLYATAKTNNSDIVVADYYTNSQTSEKYTYCNIPSDKSSYINALLTGQIMGKVWNRIERRSLYEENKLSWVKGIDMFEDLLISIKIIHFANKITYLPKAYVHYRFNPKSMTKSISDKSLQDMINFVTEITKFFKKNDIFDIYKSSLNIRKNGIQHLLLSNSNGEQRRYYTTLYPESWSYIITNSNINYMLRIALFCAVHKMSTISNMLFSLANMRKKLKAKISS